MADTPSSASILDQQHIRVKHCRHGPMAFNVQDRFIGRSFDLYGEYVEGEIQMFDQLLRPGMVALDVGANIGAHTIFMARKVQPGGVVIAFEPQRQIFQLLCANVALNAIQNVHTFHAATGAEEGQIKVPMVNYEEEGNFGGVALGGHENGETVACRTIDSYGLGQCHFMKIDVEGMECETLAGADATIKRCRPFLYIENDRRDRAEELLTRLFGLEYRVYWHLPLLYNPENFFGNTENVFEGLISRNILCLPNEMKVSIDGMQEITDPTIKF